MGQSSSNASLVVTPWGAKSTCFNQFITSIPPSHAHFAVWSPPPCATMLLLAASSLDAVWRPVSFSLTSSLRTYAYQPVVYIGSSTVRERHSYIPANSTWGHSSFCHRTGRTPWSSCHVAGAEEVMEAVMVAGAAMGDHSAHHIE